MKAKPFNQTIMTEGSYARNVLHLRSQHPVNEKGFFGPESMTWKIYREPGILIGSYRALLMQIAHPAVAEGVKQFSQFQKDYLGRAHRTFLSMASIFFGSCDLATRTAAHIHTMHYHIKGRYTDKEGQEHDFCANQPELLRWILATLTDTAILAYETLVEPLRMEEKEQFLRETAIIALLFGVPEGFFPESLEEFYDYCYQENEHLWVGETGLKLSKDVLNGPHPLFSKWTYLLATGLLPARLNRSYGLEHSKDDSQRLIRFIRFFYRLVPGWLRYAPPYYQASYRVEKLKGKKIDLLSRFFHWLGRKQVTPFLLKENVKSY